MTKSDYSEDGHDFDESRYSGERIPNVKKLGDYGHTVAGSEKKDHNLGKHIIVTDGGNTIESMKEHIARIHKKPPGESAREKAKRYMENGNYSGAAKIYERLGDEEKYNLAKDLANKRR